MSICPFMSKKEGTSINFAPCVDTCELKFRGFCSIRVVGESVYENTKSELSKKKASNITTEDKDKMS